MKYGKKREMGEKCTNVGKVKKGERICTNPANVAYTPLEPKFRRNSAFFNEAYPRFDSKSNRGLKLGLRFFTNVEVAGRMNEVEGAVLGVGQDIRKERDIVLAFDRPGRFVDADELPLGP